MVAARPLPVTGALRRNEPMAAHTSWGVGGPADRFFTPVDADDLAAFLSAVDPAEPIHCIGYGSNLLVRDGGLRGTVISLHPGLAGIVPEGEDVLVAGAGAPCARVAKFAAIRGLAGVEFLAGIPGTVGGALAMNAGAHGDDTWARVTAVQTVTRDGALRWRQRGDFEIGYREVGGVAGELFTEARMTLTRDSAGAVRARVREQLRRRGASQPVKARTCGSVFRNPPGDYAARLIEACGLKERAIGGARVSPRHANFIVNEGNATATDIERLIDLVQGEVAARTGIGLTLEVRIVGEWESAAGEVGGGV